MKLLEGPTGWFEDFDRMEAVAYLQGVEVNSIKMISYMQKAWPHRNGKPIFRIPVGYGRI